MESNRPIYVTEPYFPPLDRYNVFLERIWASRQITNHGPLTSELEREVGSYLGLEGRVHAMSNGGSALQVALRAFDIAGEIITTPFTYVATASCPLWERCVVRFADIEPESLTLDPLCVEAMITPRTEAIIATHVYGNPCDVDAFAKIASKHGLALIYDSAHAFGVRHRGRSLLEYGDAAILSAHATKLFHTAEGGFVYCRDAEKSAKVEWLRRYAHDGEGWFHGIGINAKLSELHAAMGLSVLQGLPGVFAARIEVCERYDQVLAGLKSVRKAFTLRPDTDWNQVYYPVMFESEEALLACQQVMNERRIFPRRYFHPSLNLVAACGSNDPCPVAESVADRVLCLPLSCNLSMADCDRVIESLLTGLAE